LPIYLRKAQAQRHDAIITIFALDEVIKLYPNIVFKNFLADGAMDNYPTYKLVDHFNMFPFIPLDSNVKFPDRDLPSGVSGFDENGHPLCAKGLAYRACGYSYPKGLKYRCPFACDGLPIPCPCSNSAYGRTVYLKPDFDPRLFPPVSRGSEAFKNMMKRRTTVERSHKRIFVDYNIEAGRCRSSRELFMRATMAAVNVHLDAWVKHQQFSILTLLENSSAA
jgi:hypothetical protein